MLSDVVLLLFIDDDAASSQLLRTLEAGPADRARALADKALADAQTQSDPALLARTHIVVAHAALGRREWVDAAQHSQMAMGIGIELEDGALLQGALAHGVAALLLLDEPDLALDLLEECDDLLKREPQPASARCAAVDIAEAQVWLAQARAIDGVADAAAQRAALARAVAAAQRAGEAACALRPDNRLVVCALEALVEVLLEGDSAAQAAQVAQARTWQQRLAAVCAQPWSGDTDALRLAWELCCARLDLADGADAPSVLARLLPLEATLPASHPHSAHEATLMLCLSEAFERCGNFEQALRCRKRWADAGDRLAATRAAEQAKLTQRTLDHLRHQAREFITSALPAPLSAALGHLRQARDAADDAAVSEKIARVERSTRRALELADTYLNLLSAEYSDQQALRSLDLGQLAAEACNRAQPRPASDVAIERQLEPGVRVLGDAGLLGRALDNLLSNALRHAPDGTSVCIKVTRQDESASMSVSDSGPGLPMSMRTRLFQRYATDRTDGGNGLGLALVARVARQHQARVQVQTQTGQGTTIALLMKCETTGGGMPGAVAAPGLPS
jgi:signal transduction histidine kinase